MKNRFRSINLFFYFPPRGKQLPEINCPWNNTPQTPSLSGVHPNEIVMANLKDFPCDFENLRIRYCWRKRNILIGETWRGGASLHQINR